MNWNDEIRSEKDIEDIVFQYNSGIGIKTLAENWSCSTAKIIYILKKAGVYCKVKRLDPKIPGERCWIMNDKGEIEEVRTCYDTPRYIPKWDKNPDDKDEEEY